MTSWTKDLDLLGSDIGLRYAGGSTFTDADLDVQASSGTLPRNQRLDVSVATGLSAADQLLANRLQTRKGELAPLGHPEYGSRHHDLIGEPNVERTRNLIKLYVLEALSHEPRIAEVLDCRVSAPDDPPRSVVRIELQVSIIGEPRPRNLVVPFSLDTGVVS